jgi:SAM-dependent methyltransferase
MKKLKISPDNPNTEVQSDMAFQENGLWEKNNGPQQTRLFAEYFHHYIKIPLQGNFSVLDVGCALGDALQIWHELYPQARLYGCDVSQIAVDRCIGKYGRIAQFFHASFEDIKGYWDIIYCNATLEHFEQHLEIAQHLLSQCRVLYIMTPYEELLNGKPLEPKPGSFHVATFNEDSFESIKPEKGDYQVKIIRCPGAWGPSSSFGMIKWFIKMKINKIIGKDYYSYPRMIIYTIANHNLNNIK